MSACSWSRSACFLAVASPGNDHQYVEMPTFSSRTRSSPTSSLSTPSTALEMMPTLTALLSTSFLVKTSFEVRNIATIRCFFSSLVTPFGILRQFCVARQFTREAKFQMFCMEAFGF